MRHPALHPGIPWILALGLLFPAPVLAEPDAPPEPPHLDVLSGASEPGSWAVDVELGYPTLGVRGQVGLEPWDLNVVGFASTTLRTDHWMMAGVSKRWIQDSPARPRRFTLGGELLVGGTVRGGDLARRGPALDATLRLARAHGRLVPAVALSSRHVLLTDLTELDTASGIIEEKSRSLAWSPRVSVDLGVGICAGFALAAGLTVPWFEPPGFSLPGAHLRLIVGDWR